MRRTLSRYALSMGAAALLVGCGASQSPLSASALAGSAHAAAALPLGSRALRGYYATKFTDVVGSTIPFSSLCLRFTASGVWHSVPPNAFDNGTYLISGNQFFASAQAPWSPVIYATLQGTINGTQISGDYIVMQPTGPLYSGGTFTMMRTQKKTC